MKENGKTDIEPQALDLDHELPATGTEEPLDQELGRLQAERDSLLDRLARLQAEFDNFRKRQWREQQDFRDYALTDAMKSLLPTLDSFERALAHGGGDEFRTGVELIYRQLQDTLAKLGVTPIRAEGEQFDPTLHEAVQMVETTEAKDNHVIEELQCGYKIKDRLLRPAMVRVARNSGK